MPWKEKSTTLLFLQNEVSIDLIWFRANQFWTIHWALTREYDNKRLVSIQKEAWEFNFKKLMRIGKNRAKIQNSGKQQKSSIRFFFGKNSGKLKVSKT